MGYTLKNSRGGKFYIRLNLVWFHMGNTLMSGGGEKGDFILVPYGLYIGERGRGKFYEC